MEMNSKGIKMNPEDAINIEDLNDLIVSIFTMQCTKGEYRLSTAEEALLDRLRCDSSLREHAFLAAREMLIATEIHDAILQPDEYERVIAFILAPVPV